MAELGGGSMSELTQAAQGILNEAKKMLLEIQECEKNIAEYEKSKALYRSQLEEIVTSYGNLDFPGIGSAKIVPGGSSVSFDAKQVQQVIDVLLTNQLYELAEMLTNAKKESIRNPTLRISKWKESAQ